MFRAVLALVVPLVIARSALADGPPAKFSLANHVPMGKKPSLTLIAIEPLIDVQVDLRSDGGLELKERRAALPRGHSFNLVLGNGVAGRTHYVGTVRARASGREWSNLLEFDTVVRPELKVTYRRERLDLDKHHLEFQLSRPARDAELEVLDEAQKTIGRGRAIYEHAKPDEWLAIKWTQSDATVLKLKLRITDVDGFATTLELTPWSVTIPHEEVNFATGSAAIEAQEEAKLDGAYRTIATAVVKARPYVRCRLFIAGHTDTVGDAESNRRLSTDRARAIAHYFHRKGLGIPVAYAGLGESALLVSTPDQMDEPKNRRADYVVGAEEPLVRGRTVVWRGLEP